MTRETIHINVPVLARVEGEGALDLSIENNQIIHLNLRIYEPPRYFEKFLEGRNYYDVPDAVARICGICPVAYQMSASHAIESVFNIQTTPWIRSMRRLFYCGEWLQSHSLHIHLLAAPDFLGFNSVIEMSKQYPGEVQRGLKLQSIGNDLVALFGQRSVHPVGVKIGGFSVAPDTEQANALRERIHSAKQDAIDLVHWVDGLEIPDDPQDFISVAMRHPDEYPFNEGRIVSDHGLDIAIDEFESHFKESHVEQSTALHCHLDGKPYLVGPLARLNINADTLPEAVQTLMQQLNTQFPSNNMFHSMLARAIEIYACLIEAEQLLSQYQPVEQSFIEATPQAGTGYGCSEAPRGILWHRYEIDQQGCVTNAVIVPPTSQNQSRIEEDLKNSLIHLGLDKPRDELQLHAEKIIRNYDPCISCATHFLDLNLIRNGHAESAIHTQHTTSACTQAVELSKTAVIGVGSPHEGDTLGWQAIDHLHQLDKIQHLQQQGLSLIKLDRPGLRIKEALSNYTHVILIDALKPGVTTSGFIQLTPPIDIDPPSQLSSHHTGLLESLALLQNEDECAPYVEIIGLSDINSGWAPQVIKLLAKA